jgi:hypothetical protein
LAAIWPNSLNLAIPLLRVQDNLSIFPNQGNGGRTAMSTQATPSLNSICTAVKVFVQKGDTSKDQADKYWSQAGLRLMTLKAELKRRKIGGPWYKYVQANCGLSRERADELIRIAKRLVSAKDIRAATATRMKKSRAKAMASTKKPVSRDTRSAANGRTQASNGGQNEPWEGNYGTCDYDPTDSRQVEGESYKVTRLRGFMWAVKEVKELARNNLFMEKNKADWAKLDPAEITDKVIAAAQEAADAWQEVVAFLQRRKEQSHEATEAARPSVH